MNKNVLVIGAIIILVAAIAFVYLKNIEKTGTGCDWRPTYEENTNCYATMPGFYYDGKNCIDVKACGPPREPPFKTIEECKAACEK